MMKFAQNPITLKELRSRMRGRRAFVVLTVYLLFMGGIMTLVYLAQTSSGGRPSATSSRGAGKAIFAAVIAMQVLLVIFIGPAFTAGAISGEKERQTFDLLRTTLLSAKSFVLGKLFSALSYVALLIIVSIPLQFIAFWLGGLSLSELLVSQLIIGVAAVTFAMWGLYCSSAMKTTLSASVATFAGAAFVTFGFPFIVFLFGLALGPLIITLSIPSWIEEATLMYSGLALAITNLPGTLILSEVILVEENSLFAFSQTVGGHTIWAPSPWLIFIPIYIFLAWLLYRACVRRVRRITDG